MLKSVILNEVKNHPAPVLSAPFSLTTQQQQTNQHTPKSQRPQPLRSEQQNKPWRPLRLGGSTHNRTFAPVCLSVLCSRKSRFTFHVSRFTLTASHACPARSP